MEKNIKIATSDETIDEQDNGEVSSDNIVEGLKMQLLDKEKKIEEYLDIIQRNRAEFENYKKRTEKEKKSFFEEGKIQSLDPVLNIVDSIAKGIAHIRETPNGSDSILEGMELIYKQALEYLDKAGVRKIQSVGEKFNPEIHEAVATEHDDTVEDGMVIEEFQAGYMINDRLIRPSKVKVSVHI